MNLLSKKHQEELFEYNSFMCQHCVSLNVTNEQLLEIGKEIKSKQNNKKQYHNWIVETEEENKIGYLDISSVQLRRIFSRNSLKNTEDSMVDGGNLYLPNIEDI